MGKVLRHWGTASNISPLVKHQVPGQLELLKKKKKSRRVLTYYKPPVAKYNVFPTACNNSSG